LFLADLIPEKPEYRNPKYETITKSEFSKFKTKRCQADAVFAAKRTPEAADEAEDFFYGFLNPANFLFAVTIEGVIFFSNARKCDK